MERPIHQISTPVYMPPFDIEAPEGYKPAINDETGKQYPFCCGNHESFYISEMEWFLKFPNCCERHKKYLTYHWFKKENYSRVALKILNQVAYTEYHINTAIDKPDWRTDIIDYLEYNTFSFGKPEVGYDHYKRAIVKWLKGNNVIRDKYKLNTIIGYLEPPEKKKEKDENTDLIVLYSTYQKWLKIFPFEISHFKDLKGHFEKQLPFIKGKMHLNKYLNLQSAELQTQSGLIEVLVNITKALLSKVNTHELSKDYQGNDNTAHRLKLIGESHRIKQETLLGDFSNKEIRYVTILKQWLNNEKILFAEMADLLTAKPLPAVIETNTEKIKAYFLEYGFFEIATVKHLSEANKEKLLQLIGTNKLPYQLAMLVYLGFTKHLKQHYFTSDYAMYRALAKWLNAEKNVRSVKGNIGTLTPKSKEDKEKFTAHQHKETVQKDYQNLK